MRQIVARKVPHGISLGIGIGFLLFALCVHGLLLVSNYQAFTESFYLLNWEQRPISSDRLLGWLLGAFWGDATVSECYSLALSLTVGMGFIAVANFGVSFLERFSEYRSLREMDRFVEAGDARKRMVRDGFITVAIGILMVWIVRWDYNLFLYRSLAAAMDFHTPKEAAMNLETLERIIADNRHLFSVSLAVIGAVGYLCVSAMASLGVESALRRIRDSWTELFREIPDSSEEFGGGELPEYFPEDGAPSDMEAPNPGDDGSYDGYDGEGEEYPMPSSEDYPSAQEPTGDDQDGSGFTPSGRRNGPGGFPVSILLALLLPVGLCLVPFSARAEKLKPRNQVVAMVDGSGSFKSGQTQAIDQTIRLLDGIASREAHRWDEDLDTVTVISLDSIPEAIFSGSVAELKAVNPEYWPERFKGRRTYANCTDVAKGFQEAVRYLDGSPRTTRRFLFGWTDLVAEPPMDDISRCRPVSSPSPPPTDMPWEALKGVIVAIYGLRGEEKLVWKRALEQRDMQDEFSLYTKSEMGSVPVIPPSKAELSEEEIERERARAREAAGEMAASLSKTTLAVLAALAVLGGAGYLAYRRMSRQRKRGGDARVAVQPLRPVASGTQPAGGQGRTTSRPTASFQRPPTTTRSANGETRRA